MKKTVSNEKNNKHANWRQISFIADFKQVGISSVVHFYLWDREELGLVSCYICKFRICVGWLF